MLNLFTAVVFGALGLFLAIGGAQLVALSGSPYYLAAGIVLMITAVLVIARRAAALWLHGLLILASIGWAEAKITNPSKLMANRPMNGRR